MAVETTPAAMSSAEIVALNRAHTFFSWSVQGTLDPIAIDHAEGVYLYTPEGRGSSISTASSCRRTSATAIVASSMPSPSRR
jgi:hypothetical protein